MVRTLGALCVLLALTACKANDTAQTTTSTSVMSSQSSNDTRVAKEVFGHIPTPSNGASEAIGSYARGCQSGAMELPENGQTWQAMRLSRNRNWGQPQLVSFVEDLSAFAATQPGWDGLYIGDMSQPRGGPMLTGHASHQIGLDVDIWMLPPSRLDLFRGRARKPLIHHHATRERCLHQQRLVATTRGYPSSPPPKILASLVSLCSQGPRSKCARTRLATVIGSAKSVRGGATTTISTCV